MSDSEARRERAASGPDVLFMPGTFYKGVTVHDGFVWSLSDEGVVLRLSPRPSAKPRPWAVIPSRQAGFNRFVIVDVDTPGSVVAGPTLIGIDSQTVYGVSLADGGVHALFRAAKAGDLVANASPETSPYFAGVAAGPDFFAFTARRGDELRLTIRYFNRERAPEEPMPTSGIPHVGPVVNGTVVAVCTATEITLYDTARQDLRSFALPGAFDVFAQRPSRWMSVPPGHVPFAVGETDAGWQAWIAGTYRNEPGILDVHIDRNHYQFHPLLPDACVSDAFPGLCVNHGSRLDVFGAVAPAGRFGGVAAGMPAAVTPSRSAYFRQATPTMRTLDVFGMTDEPVSLPFDDRDCNESTCCGIHFVDERELVVSYLGTGPGDEARRGLRVVRWALQ